MNRREFIVGAGAALASPFAIGKPVRSSLGADNGSKAAEGWTNPYVTDGLIAMWDGQWNVGGGVHDASATTWKNLVEGSAYNDIAVGTPGSDYWDMNLVQHVQSGTFHTPLTIEYVVLGWVNSFQTYYQMNYGDTRGDLAGGLGLTYGRIYNNYMGCYYNGNRNNLGMEYPSGKPPRFVVRWDSESAYTMIVGESKKRNISITNLDTSLSYNAFCLNLTAPNDNSNNLMFRAIRLYSRALTDDELAENWAIDKERFGL